MSVNVEIKSFPLFINGEWSPSKGGQLFDVMNPATGDVIAKVTGGTAEDVDVAVKAASEAFEKDDWRDMPPKKRSKMLYAIAQKIMEDAEELVTLEALSSGGTVRRLGSNDIIQMVDLFLGRISTVPACVVDRDISLPSPSEKFRQGNTSGLREKFKQTHFDCRHPDPERQSLHLVVALVPINFPEQQLDISRIFPNKKGNDVL